MPFFVLRERGSVTSPTTQISDRALVRQFPPLLVYFPCFRHISSPKCVLPISTTPPPPILFFSYVSDKIIITWCSAQFSDKTHKSDNPYFRQMLYPLLRQKYFTHFSDSYTHFSDKNILPTSPTVIPSSPTKMFYPFLRQ